MMFLRQLLLCLRKFHSDKRDLSPHRALRHLNFSSCQVASEGCQGSLALVSSFSSSMFPMKYFAVGLPLLYQRHLILPKTQKIS